MEWNFYGATLTFEGSLLSRALMLRQLLLQIGEVKKRVDNVVSFQLETHKSEFVGSSTRKGTCLKQNVSFEP